MFKLEILKDEVCTDRVIFESMQELNLFLEDRKTNSPFGKPERFANINDCSKEELLKEISREEREIQPQLHNEETGEITQLAVKETFIKLPTEFEVVITDVLPDILELRRTRFTNEIDPFMNEARIDKDLGKPEKLNALLEKYAQIKKELPKS